MSVFATALAAEFSHLPKSLRAFHKGPSPRSFEGAATVIRGTGPLTQVALRLGNFPPAGETGLRVTVSENGPIETWQRDFGPHRLASSLQAEGRNILERFGPLSCTLAPEWTGEKLAVKATRLNLFGVRLPKALTPESRSAEWEDAGVFQFDIAAYLPGDHLLIRYRGALEPA
ncbi:MAG: DUF4166 domain-containing protein [Pseudomonadota bacterium]